ncbi:CPBP family intramembrane glutamic endopeptidase [Halogeometricum sp. CBA1124]|uniref:CPBP family intramembrane glutamic endopeptidase n=1 Tax=Halogeometricum sp. CBA1124 TaxID=2668071 RepID=UPI00142C4504|nr:CPBP family intramembrane glutamic endopeptidase [Halogeometricum sp. CBA1124]MUV56567.1 CPBP family intramembrane metalloprotease [Halogeometricum sp. CBA1124]
MATEEASGIGEDVPVTHIAAFVAVTLTVSGAVAAATIVDTVSGVTTIPIMITPALMAIVLRRVQGQSVRRTVVGSLRGTTLRSVAFAVSFPVVFIAVAAAVALTSGLGTYNPGGGEFSYVGPLFLFPVFLLFAGVLSYGEELGWRGYLLPELTDRVGPVAATVLVGVVWALYHFPALYFGAQATGLGDPVTTSVIQMGAVLAVAAFPFSYAYYISDGSVLPPVILHLTWNLLNPFVLGNVYTNVEGFIAGQVILISGEGLLGLVIGIPTLFVVALLIRQRRFFGTAVRSDG